MDEIKDMERILMAVKYQGFAKSYFPHAAWSPPESLGHGLEIIPRTDLSILKVGDLVEVEVLFYRQPLSSSPNSKEFITAKGTGFGQRDGFALLPS